MLSFSDFIQQRGVSARPYIADSTENKYLWDVAQRYATLDQNAQKPATNTGSHAIAELAEKFLLANELDESTRILVRCFAEYVQQQQASA